MVAHKTGKTKIVEGILEEEWRKLRAWSIQQGIKTGDALNQILHIFFKKNR